MTSNLPTDPNQFFKPEFINRIDDIIHFRSLTEADLARIVTIQIDRLRDRLTERRIGLVVTDTALEFLAKAGYDPAFGARPLKRVIQREIGDRAAMLILDGKVHDGGSIVVDVTADTLTVAPSDFAQS
jgi:ATP-dependent Clp protease ATP-binding subunit ClpB